MQLHVIVQMDTISTDHRAFLAAHHIYTALLHKCVATRDVGNAMDQPIPIALCAL